MPLASAEKYCDCALNKFKETNSQEEAIAACMPLVGDSGAGKSPSESATTPSRGGENPVDLKQHAPSSVQVFHGRSELDEEHWTILTVRAKSLARVTATGS